MLITSTLKYPPHTTTALTLEPFKLSCLFKVQYQHTTEPSLEQNYKLLVGTYQLTTQANKGKRLNKQTFRYTQLLFSRYTTHTFSAFMAF